MFDSLDFRKCGRVMSKVIIATPLVNVSVLIAPLLFLKKRGKEVETVFDSLEVQIILQIITIPDAEEGFFSMSSSWGGFQALIRIVSLLFKLVS